jgi:CDP-2,3-bis-(O-geranylgeranyl)-sn-glycerol synthase
MLHDIAFALWFLLPAGAANMAPVLSAALPYAKNWQTPIDGGRKFRGRELLGSHKTWRGLISGVLVATLVFWLQQVIFNHFGWARQISNEVDYSSLSVLIVGPLFGLGALGGDAVASFFKRQRGVPSGQSWLPFDQLDYIIGAVIATLPLVVLAPFIYLLIAVIWFLLHLLVSYLGWKLGLKERPI